MSEKPNSPTTLALVFRDHDGDVLVVGAASTGAGPIAILGLNMAPGHNFYGVNSAQAPELCRAIYVGAGLEWPGKPSDLNSEGSKLSVKGSDQCPVDLAELQEAFQDLRMAYAWLWDARDERLSWPQEYYPIIKLFRSGEKLGLLTGAPTQRKSPLNVAMEALEVIAKGTGIAQSRAIEALTEIRNQGVAVDG
jgi:hypothetical protein